MSNNIDTTVTLFFEAGRMIKKKIDGKDAVPFVQAEVLRFVCDAKAPLMRDVAKHLDISAPSATSLVTQLVKGGYLRREFDAQDRRHVHLVATKKATKTLQEILQKRKKILAKLLVGLSAQDHENMQRALQKMLTNK